MKKKKHILLWLSTLLMSFLLGICLVTYIYYKEYHFAERLVRSKISKSHNYAPYNTNVEFDSSTLPIITIQCGEIQKEEYISAQMRVFPNGGTLNQVLDDEGGASYDILIKHRGQSSYGFPKKSFSIRTLDAPLDDGGVRASVSLLGMKPGKKWALLSEWSDRSYVRQALSYELARPFLPYVPQTKFCELFVNKVYFGLYQLSEQPSRKRLDLHNDGTLIYFKHPWDCEFACSHIIGNDTLECFYELKYPKYNEIPASSLDEIKESLQVMTESFNDNVSHHYESIIDVNSFVEYQLSSEFTMNRDAYNYSAYLYREGDDYLYKLTLWDNDLTFGAGEFLYLPSGWVYEEEGGNGKWWSELMKDDKYRKAVVSHWKKHRQKELSDTNITHVLDSLTNLIQSSGAVDRDIQAWDTYSSSVSEYNPYFCWKAISYQDELLFLRNWINLRLMWMDSQLK